jgi:hypothetical protein
MSYTRKELDIIHEVARKIKEEGKIEKTLDDYDLGKEFLSKEELRDIRKILGKKTK